MADDLIEISLAELEKSFPNNPDQSYMEFFTPCNQLRAYKTNTQYKDSSFNENQNNSVFSTPPCVFNYKSHTELYTDGVISLKIHPQIEINQGIDVLKDTKNKHSLSNDNLLFSTPNVITCSANLKDHNNVSSLDQSSLSFKTPSKAPKVKHLKYQEIVSSENDSFSSSQPTDDGASMYSVDEKMRSYIGNRDCYDSSFDPNAVEDYEEAERTRLEELMRTPDVKTANQLLSTLAEFSPSNPFRSPLRPPETPSSFKHGILRSSMLENQESSSGSVFSGSDGHHLISATSTPFAFRTDSSLAAVGTNTPTTLVPSRQAFNDYDENTMLYTPTSSKESLEGKNGVQKRICFNQTSFSLPPTIEGNIEVKSAEGCSSFQEAEAIDLNSTSMSHNNMSQHNRLLNLASTPSRSNSISLPMNEDFRTPSTNVQISSGRGRIRFHEHSRSLSGDGNFSCKSPSFTVKPFEKSWESPIERHVKNSPNNTLVLKVFRPSLEQSQNQKDPSPIRPFGIKFNVSSPVAAAAAVSQSSHSRQEVSQLSANHSQIMCSSNVIHRSLFRNNDANVVSSPSSQHLQVEHKRLVGKNEIPKKKRRKLDLVVQSSSIAHRPYGSHLPAIPNKYSHRLNVPYYRSLFNVKLRHAKQLYSQEIQRKLPQPLSYQDIIYGESFTEQELTAQAKLFLLKNRVILSHSKFYKK